MLWMILENMIWIGNKCMNGHDDSIVKPKTNDYSIIK